MQFQSERFPANGTLRWIIQIFFSLEKNIYITIFQKISCRISKRRSYCNELQARKFLLFFSLKTGSRAEENSPILIPIKRGRQKSSEFCLYSACTLKCAFLGSGTSFTNRIWRRRTKYHCDRHICDGYAITWTMGRLATVARRGTVNESLSPCRGVIVCRSI